MPSPDPTAHPLIAEVTAIGADAQALFDRIAKLALVHRELGEVSVQYVEKLMGIVREHMLGERSN